jgi:hypothetical protein
MIRGATPIEKSSSARSTRARAIRPSDPSGLTPRPRTTIASVLATRRRPSSVIVELVAVAGLARLEALAIPRAATIIGHFEVAAGFLRGSRCFPRTSQIVVGAADFAF